MLTKLGPDLFLIFPARYPAFGRPNYYHLIARPNVLDMKLSSMSLCN